LLMTPKAKVLIAAIPVAVVLSVVVVIPEIIKSRCTSCRDACIANLKQIDEAKANWALGTNSQDTNDVVQDARWSTNSPSNTNNHGH